MDKRFQWTSFYMELASALLKYKNNRSELIGILKTIFSDAEMNFPFKEKGKEVYEDICPFTVFGSFNKGITNANRIALLEQFAKQFSIKAAVPTEFDGIPVVMNLSAWFFAYKENRGEHDIDNLWELLEKAIAYSDEASADNKNAFITAYDTVSKQKMIKWNITMGLYWVRPYTFINLDSTNRAFITDVDNMPHYFTTIFSDINKGIPDGTSYLFMCEQAKNALKQKEYEYHSFPELSYCAWKNNQETPDEPATNRVDSNVKEIDYWIYSPGDNACMWDEFYNLGIMGIGWDDVTDLKEFTSKEEIKNYMKKVYDPSYSYKNNAHCLWQFANEIKIGDVIFVKKGMHKIIGKGVVTSEYIYDSARETYKHIRKVEWTNKGEWEHPGQAVMKTLTCISPYPDYVQRLLSLFTVPQNVRIIGMMNTADRSLALMDYALRRRFAFFDFAPAFSSEGFKNYLSEKDSPKLEKLIAAVESLNSTISTDESLGDGFRIGHSYFCTDDEITDEWLKSVVEYEVIPLIKEYWFDEPTKVRDWSATLRSAIK